jgi:small-conductance mechanosensitive channel
MSPAPWPWRRAVAGAAAALGLLATMPSLWAQAAPAGVAPGASGVASAVVAPSSPADGARENTVVVNQRAIVTFRASVLGRTPRERALAGSTAVKVVLERGGPGEVTVWRGEGAAGLQIDGLMVFHLASGDVVDDRPLLEVADAVRGRLQQAVDEVRESRDVRRIGYGVGASVLATVVAYLLMRALFALRRRLLARLEAAFEHWQPGQAGRSVLHTYWQHTHSALHGLAIVATWVVVLLLFNLWVTFVLRQFAITRYWGEQATDWMLGVATQFAHGVATAVPGLLMAVVIFLLARLASRANSALMERIERGELDVTWLDADTAGPTRRIGNLIIWLFALALAYPFLPGSDSDAFKGVSVLAGLMLSLGASSVVGQVLSGFALVYSRSLRVGEYVRAGDVEGTVTAIGLFAVKIHTGLGEEVSVPHSVVLGGSVRNFSRLAQGRFILHTAVTIGYSTPWRQVHAMLLEAARRTPGVAQEPKPYVVQTALADFYVEYRLCAQSNENAPARRAEAMSELHANVQDVFNENGVQIMSPHYLADPPQPQVVAPAHWAPPLAPAGAPPKGDAA